MNSIGTYLSTYLGTYQGGTLLSMEKRTISNKRTHKLTIVGGKSYALVLPAEFVRHLKWRERQKLNITLKGNKLIVEDWKE